MNDTTTTTPAVGLTLTLEDPTTHEPRSFILDTGLIAFLLNMILPPLLTAGLDAIPANIAPQLRPVMLTAGNIMISWANSH